MIKRLILTVSAVLLLFAVPACGGTKLAASFDENEVIDRAKAAVEVINTLDYGAMCAEFRDNLQEQVSADSLKTAWESLLTAAGTFKEYQKVTTAGVKVKETGEDGAIVTLTCAYENNTLTYTISLDTNLEVVGMWLK